MLLGVQNADGPVEDIDVKIVTNKICREQLLQQHTLPIERLGRSRLGLIKAKLRSREEIFFALVNVSNREGKLSVTSLYISQHGRFGVQSIAIILCNHLRSPVFF